MKHITTILTTMLLAVAGAEAKPLKVFILAGQSNMEGPANISTFDYIGDDPATAPLLKMMRGTDGQPTTCKGVWISYLTGAGEKNFTLSGKLTAGYGSMWGMEPTKPGDKIGPEFTFGLTMDAAFDEPVLIIKAAWGGKSLHTDFRPPSASPEGAGTCYKLMVDHVKQVLENPKKVVPSYHERDGFEIAGFVWFQGWNDLVDGTPDRSHKSMVTHSLNP